jgi:hypothetical protein
VLYQLSYASDPACRTSMLHFTSCFAIVWTCEERETGLEPATSSLEGLRSTS